MAPSSLSFSSTAISTVITFGYTALPSYFGEPLIKKSDGTTLINGVLTSSGENLVYTTPQSVSFEDYLVITSDGSWIYPTVGQYFVGGKGANTIDMNNYADPFYKDNYIAYGNDGDDKIIGTARFFDTIIGGEGADVVIDAGGGAVIDLSENFKKSDTVIITPDPLNFTSANVVIMGFDTSDTSKKNSSNDTLALNSGKIAPATKKGVVDGLDVGFIQSHTIKDGVITFTNVPISNDTLYQDALDYAYLNLAVGDTVLFQVSTSTLEGMVLYQKGSTSTNTVVIELPNVSNLTLGTKAAGGVIVLNDKIAPILVKATAESDTVHLVFNEELTKMKYDKGLKVMLNGTTDIGKVTVAANKDNTITIASKTLSLGSTDYVQLSFATPISNTVSDKFKNMAQWTKIDGVTYTSMIIATDGDTIIDLSAQTLSQYIHGNGGHDTVTGTSQADAVWGDAGNDTLIGGAGNDLLDGGTGSDTLDGGIGGDVMMGGSGDDTYVIDNIADSVYELLSDGGVDTVRVSLSTYALGENLENLKITAVGSSISGNALDNTVYSGTGDDGINGLSGVDTISYAFSSAGVTVNLSLTIQQDTKMGKDSLVGFENLSGSDFKDILTGNANNNTIFGGLEDDVITGGDGDDVLEGGLDNKNGDTLDGGNGIDTASYASATLAVRVDLSNTSVQYTAGGGFDTLSSIENITGSRYADQLQGDALSSNALTGGMGADYFYVNSQTIMDTISDFGVGNDIIVLDSAVFSSVSSAYVSYSNGVLFYDADGLSTSSGPTAFLALVGVDSFSLGNLQLGSF